MLIGQLNKPIGLRLVANFLFCTEFDNNMYILWFYSMHVYNYHIIGSLEFDRLSSIVIIQGRCWCAINQSYKKQTSKQFNYTKLCTTVEYFVKFSYVIVDTRIYNFITRRSLPLRGTLVAFLSNLL